MDLELTGRLKAEARRLGFDQVGIAPAVAPPGYPELPSSGSTPATRPAWATSSARRRPGPIPTACSKGPGR